MPFVKDRTAAIYNKEILRNVSGAEIAENAVVDGTQIPLNAANRRILESGTVMVYAGVNEVQTLTQGATGGTFDITAIPDGASPTIGSVALLLVPWTATGAAIQALYETATGRTGNLTVTGPAAGPWVFTFTGTNGGRNVSAITVSNTNLTGGTSAVTVATTTGGGTSPAIGQKVIPAPSSGISAANVAGIVMHTTEFWSETLEGNKDDAPVALFTKNCNFETSQLVSYSGNSAAVKSAMTGAGNDRCANCTFA